MGKIFALDVGTRNVVLLSAEKKDDKIKIDHMIAKEHETRAMEDGQIHDIAKVAQTVEKLREEMEVLSGEKVDEVAVAVAGRSLVTTTGKKAREFSVHDELTEEDIKSVELLAIQEAMANLNTGKGEYHCVGYTVSEYILDGISLKNPLYQKGAKLEVEVLATFLPKIVVDSMYTMVKKVDLGIKTLTLEPIAAINVVIPEDMRKLNIALVDIGAGTSDIAITKNGRIIGYGMVPMAGDELTEKIEQEYLLDFAEAERIKKELSKKGDTVSYTDILGIEFEIDKKEVLDKLDDILEELSSEIAKKIMEVNEVAPQAVILIGGGSLISNLKEKLAEKVSLVAGRVAVRGTEAIKNLVDTSEEFRTAEFVTPIGIANMAFETKGFNILEIIINNESHRVFSFTKELTLMEAFVATGIDSKDLYSMPGKPLTYTVNGKLNIIKGEMGKNSHIKVNGHNKSLEDTIVDGEMIEIKKQRDGRDAHLTIKELLEKHGKIKISINGKEKEYQNSLTLFGQKVDENEKVRDRDSYVLEELKVKDLFDENITRELTFTLDKTKQSMTIPTKEVLLDGRSVNLLDTVVDGGSYELIKLDNSILRVGDIVEVNNGNFKVSVNEKVIEFKEIKNSVFVNGQESDKDRVILNGDVIETSLPKDKLPIVSDIFKHYNPEELLEKGQGMLTIEINGKKAEFITKLQNNDVIKLFYR